MAIYYKELVDGISQFGHKISIITRYSPGAPDVEELSDLVKVFRISVSIKRKYVMGRTIDKILYARNVYKMVAKLDTVEPFDVIEVPEFNLEGYLLTENPYFNNKTIVQCHGSNAIGVIPRGIFSFLHRLDHLWSFHLELKILKNANRITVPSKAGQEFLVKNGITDEKIEIIHHGVNTTLFNSSIKKLQCPPLEVGFVGRLHKMKGLDFIWKVMDKIGPDSTIRFHLIGTIHPSEKHDVRKYLHKFSNFVTYQAHVDNDEMPSIYNSLHVLLQPSRFEQFGLVYAEAMSSGLIVFAGIKGGGSEIIRNNDNGFLVDPDRDIDFVVHKLKEMATNHASFDKIRIKARKNMIENFSIEASVKRKIEYYTKMSV